MFSPPLSFPPAPLFFSDSLGSQRFETGIGGRGLATDSAQNRAESLSLSLRNPEKGAFAKGGRCANLSQIAHQICRKTWLVFRFVHQRKGAQNCRKFVANLKVNFGQFYANTPFPMPPSPNF